MMYRMALLIMALFIGVPAALIAAGPYMKLGDIKGESRDKGHEEWIDLESLSWGLDRRVAPTSGLPTGKRQHKPVSIIKRIDKSTPLLMQSCSSGQAASAEIHLTRSGATGEQTTYLIIKMEDVIISSYAMGSGDSSEGPGSEQLYLTYSKITWTWTDGGVEYQDDWVAPK